jgi:hypothetical protein
MIFLTGRRLPGSLTPSIDAAARRGKPCRLSKPGSMGIVRPAAGQKRERRRAPRIQDVSGCSSPLPFCLLWSLSIGNFSFLIDAPRIPGYFLANPCYSALAWKNQTTINRPHVPMPARTTTSAASADGPGRASFEKCIWQIP